MRPRVSYYAFFLVFFFFHSFTSSAQSKEGEIENQQVIIEKNKKIELPEAQRDFEKIIIEKKSVEITKQEYPYNDYALPLPFVDAKLKIVSVKDEPLPKLYANYVKAGLGNYATSYLEGFLYNKRSDKLIYGLNGRYFNSINGPVKNSGLSDAHLLVYGKYFMDKNTIESELGYYRTGRQFYGYNPVMDPPKDSTKQVFNNFVWNIGLKNNDSTAKFTYGGNVEISHIHDRFFAKELEGVIRYYTRMRLDENTTSGARGLISVASRSDVTSYIRNLISLSPYYQKKWDELTVAGGINFAYENDTVLFQKNFHIYPSIRADYKLVEGMLTAFAFVDGNMEKNTLRSIVKENPWMGPRFAISHTNKLLELAGGAQGTVLNKLTYGLSFSYLQYKNLPFIVNSGVDSSRFKLVYDSSKVKVARIKLDLSYHVDKRLLAGFSLQYQSFSMGTLKNNWHVPKMQTSYYLIYYFKEKIIFNLNSYMLSGIPVLLPNGTEKTLPTIVDLNVKVDYLFSKNFSAFLELNNILANKYQRYLYYPQKGLNFLVGATCSF